MNYVSWHTEQEWWVVRSCQWATWAHFKTLFSATKSLDVAAIRLKNLTMSLTNTKENVRNSFVRPESGNPPLLLIPTSSRNREGLSTVGEDVAGAMRGGSCPARNWICLVGGTAAVLPPATSCLTAVGVASSVASWPRPRTAVPRRAATTRFSDAEADMYHFFL